MACFLGVTECFWEDSYAVWDLALFRNSGVLRTLQVTNIGITAYRELPGVTMPGRSIVVGMELVVTSSHQR